MRYGDGRLEAAQRAAGVPAALELLDEPGRALLLLSYRHRIEDSEIAARVGADAGVIVALREDRLAQLVSATGAASREDVIAWLEFVPEEGLGAALVPSAAVAVGDVEARGDVWREAKWMLALVAAFLVLYSAAEFDPASRTGTAPGDRGREVPRVAVAPPSGAGRAPGGSRAGEGASRGGARGAAGSGAVGVAAASPAAGPVASASAAGAPSAGGERGRQEVAGIEAFGGGRGPGRSSPVEPPRTPIPPPVPVPPPAPGPPSQGGPPPAAPWSGGGRAVARHGEGGASHPPHPAHPVHPPHPAHPVHPSHPVHPPHPVHPVHPAHPAHPVHPPPPAHPVHPARPSQPAHPPQPARPSGIPAPHPADPGRSGHAGQGHTPGPPHGRGR